MSEPIILPPEPDGPVWDRFGNRWDRGAIDLWDQEGSVSGDDTFEWEWWELFSRAPLFTAKPEPPWTPEVGGIVETVEQYEAMPAGSVVTSPNHVYRRTYTGAWLATGSSIECSSEELAGASRTILRVGWSL